MRKLALVMLAMIAASATGWAEGPRYVFEVRERSASDSDPWSVNMGAIAEAARLFAPTSFSKTGGRVELRLDADVSFSLGGAAELERSESRLLVRHQVTLHGDRSLRKPDRRLTVRFSLSELVKKGGAYADSPLMFALRKAIDGVSYRSGSAWIESAEYDGRGRFIIVVALVAR